ncbi:MULTISPECIES: hypothetical protein [Streptomyces]|uniref:Uncharacterized protein n=1 Tax=Streptomyces mirabilis TaxID=68239 RepID=A0ABU3V3D6_9ACTN|nr:MULTISPECIES: hypothetical protein [Streptomyces]MCX4615306.1 hypothetical protein [Streptomyces mirabilis]MCX5356636.1 hypothetical protein [Streptomyces mirabilis]MDU9000583.1 hypothetical protein [Streptomyces mirabilis]QDN84846.1 hypothetical protein FNV61_03420 [Streptomyces sp. RLB3-6]
MRTDHSEPESASKTTAEKDASRELRNHPKAFAEETTTAGIVARMVDLYPGWENRRILWHSAMAAIARKTGQ